MRFRRRTAAGTAEPAADRRVIWQAASLLLAYPDDAFAQRVAQARPRLNLIGQEVARSLQGILIEYQAVLRKLPQARSQPAAATDIAQQLESLFPAHWFNRTAPVQLAHYPRYLKAIVLRIDKLRTEPARDAPRLAEIGPLHAQLRRALAQRRGQTDARLEEFRWLLEELRVSLFAQELRTPMPVSVKRLQKAWAAIVAG